MKRQKQPFYVHGEYACFYPGPFSQWHKSPIKYEDIIFNCAEQLVMWRKAKLFGDERIANMILKATNPSEHKHLGRQVLGFNNEEWIKVRESIAVENNLLKFTQNSYLYDLLLSTGNLTLVEASPHDTIWGIGRGLDFPLLHDKSQWRGLNVLGNALTKVKQILINKRNNWYG